MLLQPSEHTEASKLLRIQRGGNVVAAGESECAKCSCMISTFVAQIPTVTIHVLHSEPQPTLGMD